MRVVRWHEYNGSRVHSDATPQRRTLESREHRDVHRTVRNNRKDHVYVDILMYSEVVHVQAQCFGEARRGEALASW